MLDSTNECSYHVKDHHRLVHEGGWQVVKVGDDVRFIARERTAFTPWRPRGPSDYLAA